MGVPFLDEVACRHPGNGRIVAADPGQFHVAAFEPQFDNRDLCFPEQFEDLRVVAMKGDDSVMLPVFGDPVHVDEFGAQDPVRLAGIPDYSLKQGVEMRPSQEQDSLSRFHGVHK